MNLEAQYREHLARQESVQLLDQYVDWLKELPLADMIKFKWVQKATNKAQQVYACLRFFGVADVSAWREQYERPIAAYRASEKLTKIPGAISAWLRVGEKAAEDMRLGEFKSDLFESVLWEIKELTIEKDPKVFIPKLEEKCSAIGIAVIFAPAPKGCPISGATKWIGTNKALIMLSLRGKTDDKRWFTFFHEAGHLLKHGRKMTFLDILGETRLNSQEELEADAFARDMIIPPLEYKKLISETSFTVKVIKDFAKNISISPGLVLGRLQFDGIVGWNLFNHLKTRYEWQHD